jgi:hypothetical protein
MRRAWYFTFLLLSFNLLIAAQSGSQRKPSTPEERKRFVEITKKLEQDPLNPELRADRDWALKWLEDIPDINVTMCTPVLGDLGASRYRYAPQVGVQFGLGMAAFIIEHPNQTTDLNAQYLAGVESALKVYSAILKVRPSAKSEDLDELLDLQAQGKLDQTVRERAKDCSTGDRAT